MRDELDKILQDKLHGLSAAPPPQAWERIGRTLERENKVPPPLSKPRNAPARIAVWTAVAALLAVALVVSDGYLNRESLQINPIPLAVTETARPAEITASQEARGAEISSAGRKKPQASNTGNEAKVIAICWEAVADKVVQQTAHSSGEKPSSDIPGQAQPAYKTNDRAPVDTTASVTSQARLMSFNPFRSARNLGYVRRRLTGSLYAANFGGQGGDSRTTVPARYSASRTGEQSSLGVNAYVVTSATHRLPLSAGLDVAFDIGKRLNIETGLTYTYLCSDYEIDISSSVRNVTQELNYIGIPVAITYTFWNPGPLEIYVRGGAMIEKGIYGVRKTDFPGSERNKNETIRLNGMQPSVMAAIGTEIKFGKRIGLYIEPGVSYYPHNDSQPESYRTVNPLGVNLRAGLRFNLRK